MRIAIQISGQLRNWREGAYFIRNNFPDADIFLCILLDNSLGNESGSDTDDTEVREVIDFLKPKLFCLIGKADAGELWRQQRMAKMINNFPVINENPDENVDYDKLMNEEGLLMGAVRGNLDISNKIFPPIQWCSQFYNVWECNELRKEYQDKNKIKYDAIIKSRFDVDYTGVLPELADIGSHAYVLNSSSYGNFIHVDDKLFVASEKNADIICDFYNHIGDCMKEINERMIPIPNAGSIEFLFAYWLWRNKIHLKYLNKEGFGVTLSRMSEKITH